MAVPSTHPAELRLQRPLAHHLNIRAADVVPVETFFRRKPTSTHSQLQETLSVHLSVVCRWYTRSGP
jgi:hypothetical protein